MRTVRNAGSKGEVKLSGMDAGQAAQVGAQVRRARRAHDWTGAELAERAGVAPGTVVRIENGRSVRPGNLRAVLDALEIPPLADIHRDVDENVRLALDIVEKSLMALPAGERDEATRALIRYMTLTSPSH